MTTSTAGWRRFVPISFWLASYETGDLADELCEELADRGLEPWAARVKTRVIETVSRVDGRGLGRVFPSLRAAVDAFGQQTPSDDPAESRGADASDDDPHEPAAI